MPSALLVLFVALVAQAAGPKDAPGEGAPAPVAPQVKPIRFEPTRAQAGAARVKAARQARHEELRALFQGAGVDYPPDGALLRAFKKEEVLELWVQPRKQATFVHLKDYAVCQASGGPGPKRRQGDLQVPEGFYEITAYNPWSSFHLAMLVSYPNPSDAARKSGRDAGGNICIHGDCVTIGCLPLTDRWIEELYLVCLDTHTRTGRRVRVQLYPARLDEEGLAALEAAHPNDAALLGFWRELKSGHDLFEQSRIPPRVSFGPGGAYRFRPGR
jgi:murein L,D-transpeptidase YafK